MKFDELATSEPKGVGKFDVGGEGGITSSWRRSYRSILVDRKATNPLLTKMRRSLGIDSGPGALVNPSFQRILSRGFVPGTGHEVTRAIYVDCA